MLKSNTFGFTLFELIIVIAIVAIMSVMVAPGFSGYIADQKTAAISTALHSALQLARNEAIKRNHNVIVCPIIEGSNTCSGTDWTTGWMVQDTVNANIIQVFPSVLANSITVCANIPNNITFSPTGPHLPTAELYVKHPTSIMSYTTCNFGAFLVKVPNCNNMYQISVDNLGHATISNALNCQ